MMYLKGCFLDTSAIRILLPIGAITAKMCNDVGDNDVGEVL